MGNRWLRGCAWVVEKAESYNSRSLGAVEGRKQETAREFWAVYLHSPLLSLTKQGPEMA